MYVQILTLFLGLAAPGGMTTAEFNSKQAGDTDANGWTTLTKQTYGSSAHFIFLGKSK